MLPSLTVFWTALSIETAKTGLQDGGSEGGHALAQSSVTSEDQGGEEPL